MELSRSVILEASILFYKVMGYSKAVSHYTLILARFSCLGNLADAIKMTHAKNGKAYFFRVVKYTV